MCAHTTRKNTIFRIFFLNNIYLCLYKFEVYSMRILIVNTSEQTGGAAVAANRLMEALNNNGEKAKMLVRDKQTDHITVVQLPNHRVNRWRFAFERARILLSLRFNREHLWDIDTAQSGYDITRLPEFKEADIVHLHWVNQGMLSLKTIKKILQSGKPVVWTMHDMWPATAICHYAGTCKAFQTQCKKCPFLGKRSENDLSARVWARKLATYNAGFIQFVTCSRWLEGLVKQSQLLKKHAITSIPNTINTNVFRKTDKQEARKTFGLPADKRILLFVSQRVTVERKGMRYFIEALQQLTQQHPEIKDNTCVAILGGNADEIVENDFPLQAFPLGYIEDEHKIVSAYNAADCFVLPSLEDNLPNTIMEALACGVPCVGFKVGGIPEMIDHRQNGYVAEYRNATDLANGIYWTLFDADAEALSHAAIKKVNTSYSQQSVALKYIEVYNQAKAYKHYLK